MVGPEPLPDSAEPGAQFGWIIAVSPIWFIDRIPRADTMGTARSGWLSRTVLAVTFLGMTASVPALFWSYLTG